MSTIGRQLLELQQIDLTLRQNQKRLSDISTALNDSKLVQEARRAVEMADETLKPLKTQLRDLELQAQSSKQKSDNTEKRLYSGEVSNPKELQDMQRSIASLQKWQDQLEDQMLELMMTIEDADDSYQQAKQHLTQVTAQTAHDNQDLTQEQSQLHNESDDLHQEREAIAAQLDADTLTLYQTLQAKTAYRPIAQLSADSTCTICGVQQTSIHAKAIRQAEGLLRCQNCNRIIIAS